MQLTKVNIKVPNKNDAAPDMPEKWADGEIVNAQRIFDRLTKKIPGKGKFISEIATPSTEAMKDYVNPAFVSKSEHGLNDILSLHEDNTAGSYEKWILALTKAFETDQGEIARRFKEMVTAKKGNLSRELARKALRFVGDKIRGYGCAPIGSYWLVGYKKAVSMLHGADTAEGGPVNVVASGLRPAFKAAVQEAIVQAGILIDVGKFQPSVFTLYNDRLNHLVQSFVDPGLGLVPFATGALSHIDYKLVDGVYQLEIQVNQV